MQTLVIGANGNLGKEIARQLSETEKVKAGIRNEKNFLNLENAENVVFDYDNAETFSAAVEEVNKVFIQAPPLDSEAFKRLIPFIDFLKEKNIKRIVFNSAWGVDHNDEAPLRKIEKKLMASSIQLFVLISL